MTNPLSDLTYPILCLLVLLLAACKPAPQFVGASGTKPKAPVNSAEWGGKKSLYKQCGGAEMTLRCAGKILECAQTSLQLETPEDKIINIVKPKEMANYTAVGIGCAVSQADGAPYFFAQYGELPFGCQFCEWFYLYDARGNQLTRSDPMLLTDEELPGNNKRYPNNEMFDEWVRRLGWNTASIIDSIDYVKCKIEIDSSGATKCLQENGDD